MNNKLTIILILLSLVSFTSFKISKNAYDDLGYYRSRKHLKGFGFKGLVKKVTYKEKGIHYYFDKKGNLIRRHLSDSLKNKKGMKMTIDLKKNRVVRSYYGKSGNLNYRDVFDYNEFGDERLLSVEKNPTDSFLKSFSFLNGYERHYYHEKSRKEEIVKYNSSGKPTSTKVVSYDTLGNPLFVTYYRNRRKTGEFQKFTYNDKGDMIERVQRRQSGSIWRTVHKDSNNASYMVTQYSKSKTTFEFYFDETKSRIDSLNYYNRSDELYKKKANQYFDFDKNGNYQRVVTVIKKIKEGRVVENKVEEEHLVFEYYK